MPPPERTVVIPAAVPVNSGVGADFGVISPIRLPAGATSLGARLWNEYASAVPDVRFVLTSRDKQLVRAGGVSGLPADVTVISADETTTIADSVLAAFKHAPLASDALLTINFGDTFVNRQLCGEDRVVVSESRSVVRWTTLAKGVGGSWQLSEKNSLKSAGCTHWIITGVFEFADGPRFLEILREARQAPPKNIEPFFVALMEYFNDQTHSLDKALEDCTNRWLDFGHIDTLHSSRLALGGGSRSFNDITVDSNKGLVTKRSARSEDFKDERNWYFTLPQTLSHIAPRVLSEPSDEHLTLEYYGYPSLQDLYLHSSLDLGDWEQILMSLDGTLSELSQTTPLSAFDASVTAAARKEMYLSKTLRRMSEASANTVLSQAWSVSRINGLTCPTAIDIELRLEDDLKAAGLLEPQTFGVIHGDFCLSNILYDRRSGALRAIDPRGRFGDIVMFGDSLYDEAKLRHSFNGHYDLLVYESMSIAVSSSNADLHIPLTNLQQDIRALFAQWQLGRLKGSTAAVGMIEAGLFLSMVPLHMDRPEAQRAFVLRGRELYAQAIDFS